MGNLDAAVQHYRRSLQLAPQRAESYFELGFTYFAASRLEEAREALGNSLRYDQEHCDALYFLGRTLADLGDYVVAEGHRRSEAVLDAREVWVVTP